MTTDRTRDPQPAAVEQLEQLGLSSYASRPFVALAGLGAGTAREISRVSDVPRTGVYDAMAELGDRGLVDVQGPRRSSFVQSPPRPRSGPSNTSSAAARTFSGPR